MSTPEPVSGTPARPAVSVIVPTYERREYVGRAVRSVLAQTFTDFELIVVDDGSTDGTGEALAGLDSRLRYAWQPNRGVAAARNAGIAMARGDIVAFLDSDNRWLPHHLALVTRALELHPEAVLVSTCVRFQPRGHEQAEQAEVVDLLPRLGRRPLGFVSCVAVRRSALEAAGGFDERLAVWEDTDLWFRLAGQGPFCLVRNRTLIRQATKGGLRERGVQSGEAMRAMELSFRRAAEELERSERFDAAEIAARFEAQLCLLEAIRAVERSDAAGARRQLEDACRSYPSCSTEVRSVLGVLTHASGDIEDRIRVFASIASRWPDPLADTPLFLRAWAAVASLRTRRLRQAARLAAHRGFLARPGFAVRTFPITADMVRGWGRGRLHGGRESSLVGDPARRPEAT